MQVRLNFGRREAGKFEPHAFSSHPPPRQVPLFRDVRTDMAPVTALDHCCEADAAEAAARAVADPELHPHDVRDTVSTAAAKAAISTAADRAAACAVAAAAADADVGPALVPLPGHVHLDAMAFGMGCCCLQVRGVARQVPPAGRTLLPPPLQVTFQARDLDESRALYDQLGVLSPLLLALTANTPIWRGRLADTDTRWDYISGAVDCRTPAERGVAGEEAEPAWQRSEHAAEAAGGGLRRLPKSRYSSIDCFISDAPAVRARSAALNDLPFAYDEKAFQTLVEGGAWGGEGRARGGAVAAARPPLLPPRLLRRRRRDACAARRSPLHARPARHLQGEGAPTLMLCVWGGVMMCPAEGATRSLSSRRMRDQQEPEHG